MRTIDYYKELAAEMQRNGCRFIQVKTWPESLTPARGIELVRALKEVITVPIVVHTLHKRYCTTHLKRSLKQVQTASTQHFHHLVKVQANHLRNHH